MALCLYSPSLFSTQRFFLSSYTCSFSFTFFSLVSLIPLSRLLVFHVLPPSHPLLTPNPTATLLPRSSNVRESLVFDPGVSRIDQAPRLIQVQPADFTCQKSIVSLISSLQFKLLERPMLIRLTTVPSPGVTVVSLNALRSLDRGVRERRDSARQRKSRRERKDRYRDS